MNFDLLYYIIIEFWCVPENRMLIQIGTPSITIFVVSILLIFSEESGI